MRELVSQVRYHRTIIFLFAVVIVELGLVVARGGHP